MIAILIISDSLYSHNVLNYYRSGQQNLVTVLEFSQYNRSDSLGVNPPLSTIILMGPELTVISNDILNDLMLSFSNTSITYHWHPFCL